MVGHGALSPTEDAIRIAVQDDSSALRPSLVSVDPGPGTLRRVPSLHGAPMRRTPNSSRKFTADRAGLERQTWHQSTAVSLAVRSFFPSARRR